VKRSEEVRGERTETEGRNDTGLTDRFGLGKRKDAKWEHCDCRASVRDSNATQTPLQAGTKRAINQFCTGLR
jgi:hypothetical protein